MSAAAKILVVDDEASVRFFLQETLQRDGYLVECAENGETALQHLAAVEFDLVLVDLLMGDIGGLEVLAAVRQQAPDTVVIVITGYGSLQTAVEALRHGAHDYLFKPVQPDQVRESVRTGLLKGQRNRQQRELLTLTQHLLNDLANGRAAVAIPCAPRDQPALPALDLDRPEAQKHFLQYGGLNVDLVRHIVTLDGQLLELSPTEFELITCLAGAAPAIVSPKDLVRTVQGYECESWEASEMLRYHIHRIRQKIKQSTGRNIIRTVRGVGYTLELEAN